MKLFFILFILFTFFQLNAQTYDAKKIYIVYGKWNREISVNNKISILSYVTKQNILTCDNEKLKQKTVSDIPKYRYELILVSKSTYNNKLVDTWIYNTKVFIDGIEITNIQFPNGFTAIVNVKPTTIYWYETSNDSINFKVTWQNSNYFRNNN